MNYEIVTDTSANLPSELAREKEIGVIPFSYYVEGEEHVCLDTDAFDGADYYRKLRSRVKITTSQITPQRYVEHLEPLLKEGRDVLYIGMSSGISGSYQSAVIAAQQLREAYPERKIKTVDTLGASLGEGLVVLKAAQWRSEGKTIDEAETAANEMARHMYQIFIVDDLFQLRQLGRLSNAASIVGTVLQIKPLLKGNEQGQIVCIGNIVIAASLLIVAVSGGTLLAVFMVIAYAAVSTVMGPFWAIPPELGHPSIAAEASGFCLIFGNLGGTIIGFVLTAVASATGTYYVPMFICMGMAVVSALLVSRIKR